MENPRVINRFLLAILIAWTVSAVTASIYFHDASILLYYVIALALMFAAFGFVGICNVILFAPIFWLMGKLTAYKPKSRSPDIRN
jgi:hypothetical protein